MQTPDTCPDFQGFLRFCGLKISVDRQCPSNRGGSTGQSNGSALYSITSTLFSPWIDGTKQRLCPPENIPSHCNFCQRIQSEFDPAVQENTPPHCNSCFLCRSEQILCINVNVNTSVHRDCRSLFWNIAHLPADLPVTERRSKRCPPISESKVYERIRV